ncbi:MAG TPA: hypothetical protein PK869_10275, partial [Candidatus Hydrogenedentes bacterium]|nr:hypothetical protein [Candidatus Hydrogenedentota bacterium]
MRFSAIVIFALSVIPLASGQEMYTVQGLEPQPVIAQASRLSDALAFLGSSLKPEDVAKLKALADAAPSEETSVAVQAVLDPYCLAPVHINPEMRVKVHRGPAAASLMQNG